MLVETTSWSIFRPAPWFRHDRKKLDPAARSSLETGGGAFRGRPVDN
jgi:hypothetical protein